MCRYYAHAFSCKHTTLTFACFCPSAALIQTPCGDRHIWQTLALDESCEECKNFYHAEQHHGHGHRRRGR